MSNLIITVISIALIAVAALMGLWYGGTAFTSGKAKAQASQIISEAKQIEGAINFWRVDHGAATDLPGTDLSFLVTQGYLSQLTSYAGMIQPAFNGPIKCGAPDYRNDFTDGVSDCNGNAGFAPSRFLVLFINGDPAGNAPFDLCKAIYNIAHGNNTAPDPSHILPDNQKFDCVRMYSGGASTWSFVYTLF